MAVIYALLKVYYYNVLGLFDRLIYIDHKSNRRYFCANGSFLLLPLARKWRLFATACTSLLICICVTHTAAAASLTISIPNTLSLDVTPSAAGTFVESEEAKISIIGADFGYTLSIASQDGKTNDLIGEHGTLPSIKTQYTGAQGESGAWPVNTWGYKPDKLNGSLNEAYLPGPTDGDVIEQLPTALGANHEHTIKIAAKVDNTIAAGTYSNTFVLTVTANKVEYTINYDANGGTGGPTVQTGQSENMNVKLTYEEPGSQTMAFEGWCTKPTNDATCNGERYYPGDDYTLNVDKNNVTLYAIWDQPEAMQNWYGCKDLEKNRQISLIDTRDNRLYYVAKLADGNCWMTENLDLFLDPNKPLTPEDSDVEEEWTPPATHKTGDSDWMGDKVTGNSTANTENGENLPQSYDPGNQCWNNENGSSYSEDCPAHDESHFHVGNFYNYAAAVAQSDAKDHANGGQTYNTSICPSGWQLPTYIGRKSFIELKENTDTDPNSPNWVTGPVASSTIDKEPYFFSYSGWWRGHLVQSNSVSVWWTNAVVSSTHAYSLYINTGNALYLQNTGTYRLDGFYVRCVARDPSMQDVAEWGDTIEEGETVTAIDERDGKTYTVARLADGNLWMTQNLAIGSNEEPTVLTYEKTDLDQGVQIDGEEEAGTFTLPQGSSKLAETPDDHAGWHFQQYNTKHIYINEDKAEYGGYYSWFTATLGEGTKEMISGETSYSICPKGWRLPKFTEFRNLIAVSSGKMAEPPANFGVFAGRCVESGCPNANMGNAGYWWTSTAAPNPSYLDYAGDMHGYNTGEFGAGSIYKGGGSSIRCIAR